MYTKETIRYGPHPSEFMDLYLPTEVGKNTSTLAGFVHGGFFKEEHGSGYMTPIAEDLAGEGYTVANIEYPRVGEGLDCIEMIRSVCKAFTFASSLPGIEKRVAIGHSAGGYHALMLLLQKQVAFDPKIENPFIPDVVIAQAPVSDLWRAHKEGLSDKHDAIFNFVQSERTEVVEKSFYHMLNPMMYQIPGDSKVYIFHGEKDKEVPLSHSNTFVKTHPGSSLFSGEFDHFDVIKLTHETWELQKKYI